MDVRLNDLQVPAGRSSAAVAAAPAPGPRAARGQRALTRASLPGPVRVSAGTPRGEFAVFLFLVPLLSVPVLLATMGAAWAAITAGVLAVAVTWVCAARRVVIGNGWIADRRLWHYRVTHSDELRAVEFVENGHGGVLRLSPHGGRAHRLRRAEFDRPDTRSALASVMAQGNPSVGPGVRKALAPPSHA